MALQSLVQAQTVLVLIIAFLLHIGNFYKVRWIIENLVDLSSKTGGVGILRCQLHLRMLPPRFRDTLIQASYVESSVRRQTRVAG